MFDSLFDKRIKVKNTQEFPWVVHGLVTTSFDVPGRGEVLSRGTGTLISPECFLTAAHCLHLKSPDGESIFPSSIKFYSGIKGLVPGIESDAIDSYIHPSYTEEEDHIFDFGVVHLEKPLGKILGHATLRVLDHEDLQGQRITIAGYPAQKSFFDYLFRTPTYDMYEMSGDIKVVDPNILLYDVDTSAGQSGAGVCSLNEDGMIECLGIHTTGSKLRGNGAVRLNQSNYELINEWLHKFGQSDES